MTEAEDCFEVHSEKFLQSDIPDKSRSRRKAYARDYLLSFANLSFCRFKPADINPELWRELQAANMSNGVVTSGNFSQGPDRESERNIQTFRDIPEWRRTSIHPGSMNIQQISRRKPYDDETAGSQFSTNYSSKQAPQWGETTQSRNNSGRRTLQASGSMTGHGKWGHCGDWERERSSFHLNHKSDQSDSGHSNVGSPSVRPGWNMAEHDGLLGSGESGRGNFGNVAGCSLKVPEKFHSSCLGSPSGTSNETFHSPKVPFASRRQGSDSMNDETFGAEEQSSDERLEQERKRRESFELMRRECKRPQEEKSHLEAKIRKEQEVAEVEQTVDKMHDKLSTWDENIQVEHRAISSESRNKTSSSLINDIPFGARSPEAPALMSVPSVSRLLVPPGFSQDNLPKMNECKSPDIEELAEKMAGLAKDGGNPEIGEANQKAITVDSKEASRSHSNIQILEKRISQISELMENTVGLIEESRSDNENNLDRANLEIKGVTETAGSYFNSEEAISGEISPKMSKFAKWFGTEGAEQKSRHGVSGVASESKILSFFPKSMNSDHFLKEVSCKSLEDANCCDKATRSSSGFCLPPGNPAQVLPMPVGPSLEDIEKDLTLPTHEKDDNPSSPSHRRSNDGVFGQTGGHGHVDTTHHISLPHLSSPLATVPKVFLTCEDIEQSLLAENRGHDEQLSSLVGMRQSTSSSPVRKEDRVPNKFASKYLLSLLHKGTKDIDFHNRQGAEEVQRRFSEHEPFLEHELDSHNKDECPVPTLEALFGKAFMTELRSNEAPVSVQSFPSGMNELPGASTPDFAEVKSIVTAPMEHMVYSASLSNTNFLRVPLTSSQRYSPEKVGEGSHPTLPMRRYQMDDDQDFNYTRYLPASQLPPVDDSALLFDMLAGRPSRNCFSGNHISLSRSSSAESLERSMRERRKESGGRNKPINIRMANSDAKGRSSTALENVLSNASVSQLFEELPGGKDVKAREQAELFSEQLCRGVSSSSVAPVISHSSKYGGRSIEFPLSDKVVESIPDGISSGGGHVDGLTEKGALQELSPIASIDGQLDKKNPGLSFRVIDAVCRGSQNHPMYKSQNIDRAQSLSKDIENNFLLDKANTRSASSHSTKVSSIKLQSHSSLPIEGLYRSHSPVSAFSGLNVPLDHLQQALVSNDMNLPTYASPKQMRSPFLYSTSEQPPMHHTNNGNKMDFYSGLRHQQGSAFEISLPNTSKPNQPYSQHIMHDSQPHSQPILPDSFLNPHASFPRAFLSSNFNGGQFPQHGFNSSMNMHPFLHEQLPYDSHNFLAKGTHGYFPLEGPLHHPMLNTNLPYMNVDFQHGHPMEHPLQGHGQPDINWRPRDASHRFSRMPPHWS